MSYPSSQTEPHVKDTNRAATVMHSGGRNEAPNPAEYCDGTLTVTQEAWADVTRCDKCKYYSYFGIGD